MHGVLKMSKLGVEQTNMDVVRSALQSATFLRIFLIDIIFLSFAIVWYKREFDLFLMLTVIFLSCVFVITPKYYREILFFTIAFPIVEIICIFFGLWQYSVTSILLIPLWLFPAWGQAVFTIIICHRGLQKRLYKD